MKKIIVCKICLHIRSRENSDSATIFFTLVLRWNYLPKREYKSIGKNAPLMKTGKTLKGKNLKLIWPKLMLKKLCWDLFFAPLSYCGKSKDEDWEKEQSNDCCKREKETSSSRITLERKMYIEQEKRRNGCEKRPKDGV